MKLLDFVANLAVFALGFGCAWLVKPSKRVVPMPGTYDDRGWHPPYQGH